MLFEDVLIPTMIEDHIARACHTAGALDCWADLLVNAIFPADASVVAEELNGVKQCGFAAPFVGWRSPLHQIGRVLILEASEQSAKSLAILAIDPMIAVEPKNPLTARVANAFIACRGEIVAPRKVKDLG